MRNIFLGIIILSVGFTSCLKGNSGNTCDFNPCGYRASDQEIQAIQEYLDTNNLTAVQHCSGLFYRVEDPGTGATPTACSNITVTYKSYFIDGTVFDQGTTPIPVSLDQTIIGWRSGLQQIKAGGRIVLYVPPSLAYGNQDVTDQNGNVVIPAGSYLVFEVNLVSVN